jgi:hypothetical protein
VTVVTLAQDFLSMASRLQCFEPSFSTKLAIFILLSIFSTTCRYSVAVEGFQCRMSQSLGSQENSAGRAMLSATGRATMRVVSYNVLSSHLSSPSHFISCDPKHLAAENRLPKVKAKLNSEIASEAGSSRPIICLQEISQSWEGPLHVFFASHNYHFITGLYGRKFNNYMGIGIAYPCDKYDLLDADIARLSDYREGGWPRPSPEEQEANKDDIITALFKTGYGMFSSMVLSPAKSILGIKAARPVSHFMWSCLRHI